jgi:hypothetical protein
MSVVVDCMDVNLFSDQDLDKLQRITLDCVVKGVVAEVVLLKAVNTTLAEDRTHAHHVVKDSRIRAALFRVHCKDVHQVLALLILPLDNCVICSLGQ